MIQLVERDHEIIKFLRDQGWALAPQIASRFFSSRHACSNRMRQLIRAGIIESVSMSQFRSQYWHEKGLLNIVCVVNGRTKIYRLSESVRSTIGKRWARAASDQLLTHQVLVGRVRETLEKTLAHPQFVSEGSESFKTIGTQTQDDVVIPDLVCKVNQLKLAIEIERKGRRGLAEFNSAYEDRFDALSLEYDLVLYVVEQEDHLKPLIKKGNGRSKIGFSSILNPQEVFRLGYDPVDISQFVKEHYKGAA